MVLLVQNNADKRIWDFQGIYPDEVNHLYIVFLNFEIPSELPDGEYTYALLAGDSAVIEKKADFLETTFNGVKLKDLHPAIGLLRIGVLADSNSFYEAAEPKNYYYTN